MKDFGLFFYLFFKIALKRQSGNVGEMKMTRE
jgi:hypothetical protein